MSERQMREWIGRTEVRTDTVTAAPIAALAATLDIDGLCPEAGDPLPPLWHWLYFLPIHRQSELGADGHAERGGFLPPVDLPRRMWAGGRLEFHTPLQVGERITRTSRIADVRFREGRTGPLVFVLVKHEIANAAGVAITEEHDIVYRGQTTGAVAPSPRPTAHTAGAAAWERVLHPDDVLLFRYSALTFNGHRIHYDRRYATEVEGYPGLVVHGPLLATLLADLVRRNLPAARASRFEFRALSPVFDTADFAVCGRPEPSGEIIRLWVRDASGALAMDASLVVERGIS
ncbi:MAG TPA: MaoC family dehydratase N-terminal domain-containing protein [Bryobacteraceae bacterium]|nr:MaoC family dehydratase N-terminal domain-containing protein [Bryobacteraceae bacterium]